MAEYRRVTFKVPMRFRDIDAYGHVNHAEVFTYLEEARIRLFGDRFELRMKDQPVFLVKTASCEYHVPIQFGSEIEVRMSLDRMGKASFSLSYDVADVHGDTIYASANTTMVCVDPATGRPTPVPQWFRDHVEA